MSRFPDINAKEMKVPVELQTTLNLPSLSDQQLKLFQALQQEFTETFGIWCQYQKVQLIQSLLPEQDLHKLEQYDQESAEAAYLPLNPIQGLLVVPVKTEGRSLIAFAKVASDHVKSYLRIANLVLKQHQVSEEATSMQSSVKRLQNQVRQLEEENQNYLLQITADMEELTFLRKLCGFLELKTDQANCLEQLFLTVAGQAKANFIGFVPNENNDAGSLQLPAVCFANPESPDDSGYVCNIEEMKALLGAVNPEQPVTVLNGLVNKDLEQLTPPGIDSVLICSVKKSEREFGWLIAVNRAQHLDNDLSFAPTSLKSEFGSVEAGLLSSAAAMLATHFSNLELLAANKELVTDVVRCLVTAIESKDSYTCGHSERVAQYGRRIGEELGLDDKSLERLYLSGLLHDVGKIGIADSILLKPSTPTDAEFEEIKKHPHEGWRILQGIKQLESILDGVLFHHERVDGKGYPDGLSGNAIPMAGRILAVADSFDAMTSDRPYRNGMSSQSAQSIIKKGAGTQWDEKVVDAFFRILDDLEGIKNQYCRLPAPQRIKNSIQKKE